MYGTLTAMHFSTMLSNCPFKVQDITCSTKYGQGAVVIVAAAQWGALTRTEMHRNASLVESDSESSHSLAILATICQCVVQTFRELSGADALHSNY